MTRTLIRGGCVLTMGRTNYPDADVLIEDGRIAEIGHGIRARDAEQIDGTGTIVMPGFVDTHRHVADSLFRNTGHSPATAPELVAPLYGADDVYAATLIGLLGAVDAGITTVADCCRMASAGPAHFEAALQAHRDVGTRSVVVIGETAATSPGWEAALHHGEAGPLTTLAAGPEGGAGDRWEVARRCGMRIHSHAIGRGSVSSRAAMLDGDVTLVHCTDADDGDLDAIHDSGARVSLTPSNDMATGLGMPPVQGLIDRNIRPGLGVDSDRFAPGDLFAQIRALISMQHATVFDRKLAGKAGLPKLLTTREVIRYATIDGAAAIGLEGITGALEPGQRADLVVLRADRPNIYPVNDPIGAVVWGMDTSNIDWVFVEGQALKRHGELQADVDSARAGAGQARGRIAAAAGVESGVRG